MQSEQMRALIERVEKATGPDRELDAEIAVAIGRGDLYTHVITYVPEMDTPPQRVPWRGDRECPRYTASLDAAASLVPSGWIWWVNSRCYARCWTIQDERVAQTAQSGLCATPALALTAAALRARLAEMETRDAG